MSIHLHWYLPTNGDSREIVGAGDDSHLAVGPTASGMRPPTIDYLGEIARTAERLGFEAVLTPTGTRWEDAWITTAALSQTTTRLKFLVAFRPGFISPTLAAHQAATFQRISGGRLLLNIVAGGDPVEQARYGDHLDHDARYRRTGEFLEVVRGVSTAPAGSAYDFDGEYYRITGARIDFGDWDPPQIFFGGASEAAEDVAAQHVDTYLAWGETPTQIAERLERMRTKAAAHGRTLRFGIRLHVISRDTSADAWTQAERLLSTISPERIASAQQVLARTESVGQQRMTALHDGGTSNLEISPNLWAGYGLVRGGAGTALVGSHTEVADRISEYHALGIDHFILSGQPHIEEAYWFAEGAGAILRDRGLL
ncbi:LLM class flavin-dependent oxidoreductase [Mycolicibacterium smegmatis]|uniref:Alkanesulfonate monooxygenase n=3 Tax=Mycolicibacterium smegmatis TaxID=1772 RepID=A0R0X3_MYCS2|nr:LLM class flavin-dependent oxidoreductase [Mycolicibacterium smegmatis]ABK70028.1 alkanesulfonate monooxygenase [Mycolicibacterium smegmatis MC2 155]AFP40880.1 Alkanesulfonate monooxygenase 2 [Mycolicibacterium smegmatis MC2 155]AIU09610.1 alkanesulfonate monooxygenase [Mycolicibacterium smegmatis MC2 155]AIU16235.1 alkanesulfonate monooxygenase [Mycolicibacterium smegmatis]AIU22858.1 alkanesulfonate monooxygenase [Mycolicibacterium smegmatis]